MGGYQLPRAAPAAKGICRLDPVSALAAKRHLFIDTLFENLLFRQPSHR
jgi:hypothetical protein